MSASLNPDAPIVVSSSTDIGYIVYLMSQTEFYRDWTSSEAIELILPALKHQQLRLYCDHEGAPTAFIAWAFVDATNELRLRQGLPLASHDAWRSGERLWLLHFAAPYGHARGVARDLRENVFAPGTEIQWRRHDAGGRLGRVRIGTKTASTVRRRGPKSASAIIQAIMDNDDRPGRFTDDSATGSFEESCGQRGIEIGALLGLDENSTVLEVGCRMGAGLAPLAERYDCHAYGTDVGGVRIDVATSRHRDVPKVEFRQAHPNDLPFADGSFDRAITDQILSRQDDASAALAECNRVLIPGARLVVGEIVTDNDSRAPALAETFGMDRMTSAEDWHRAIAQAGFDILKTEDRTADVRRTYELVRDAIEARFAESDHFAEAIAMVDQRLEAIDRGDVQRVLLVAEKQREARPTKASAAPKTSLLMLSGGLDSVYTLWKLLNETDDTVLVHHINFVNDERRHVIEAERCRRIVNFLKSNVRDFAYTESSIDHRQYRFFGYDMIAVGFEAGLVAHSHLLRWNRPVDRWTVGTCTEEGGWSARFKHVEACLRANTFPHPAPEFFALPIVTKQEEIDSLPEELVGMCWGCRRPVLTDAGYKACGRCHTCETLNRTSFQEVTGS